MGNCRVEGCPKPPGKGKNGYCYMHINRIRKYGDPGPVESTRSSGLSVEEKLRYFGWEESAEGCWLWNGTLSHGYGYVSINAKQYLTHRVAYETWVGPIPDGMVLCHRCDTPRCINPAHLFVGTQAENLADMSHKGRRSRGERRYNARLTESDVIEARRMRVAGVPVSQIADRFGVSKRQAYKIVNGEQWKHV